MFGGYFQRGADTMHPYLQKSALIWALRKACNRAIMSPVSQNQVSQLEIGGLRP